MKAKTGKTYIYQGKQVRVLESLDPKHVLVTDGRVFTVRKKDLEKLHSAEPRG